jgi:hypothetical protein
MIGLQHAGGQKKAKNSFLEPHDSLNPAPNINNRFLGHQNMHAKHAITKNLSYSKAHPPPAL